MRRAAPFVFYGLGGIAVAGALAWASFTVAGQQLSTPANPIQPVALASSPQTETDGSPVPSAHAHGATPTAPPSAVTTPSATQPLGESGSLRPSQSPDGLEHGDGGGRSGDD